MMPIYTNLERIRTGGGGGSVPSRPRTDVQTTGTNSIARQTKVVDEFGDPLPKAHVYFSQNNGTTTNANGTAFLTGKPAQTVTVSYVGMGSKQFSLESLPPKITLIMQANQMDEVVITSKQKNKTPKYLWPALGGVAALLILMSVGSEPKKVTL
jgi:hypothetical protein